MLRAVTFAGFHVLNHGMFDLAQGYSDRGMADELESGFP